MFHYRSKEGFHFPFIPLPPPASFSLSFSAVVSAVVSVVTSHVEDDRFISREKQSPFQPRRIFFPRLPSRPVESRASPLYCKQKTFYFLPTQS